MTLLLGAIPAMLYNDKKIFEDQSKVHVRNIASLYKGCWENQRTLFAFQIQTLKSKQNLRKWRCTFARVTT